MAGTGRREKAYLARIARGEAAQADRQFYRYSRFVPTADWWAPSYFIDGAGVQRGRDEGYVDTFEYAMVKGTVMLHPPPRMSPPRGRQLTVSESHWFVRICFWGNDDMGVEKDAYFPDKESAKEQYHRWVTYLNNIAIACWRDLLKYGGFWHA